MKIFLIMMRSQSTLVTTPLGAFLKEEKAKIVLKNTELRYKNFIKWAKRIVEDEDVFVAISQEEKKQACESFFKNVPQIHRKDLSNLSILKSLFYKTFYLDSTEIL